MLVYCSSCTYFKIRGSMASGVVQQCRKFYSTDHYIYKTKTYADPKDINLYGGCKDYKRKWWHFWAAKRAVCLEG